MQDCPYRCVGMMKEHNDSRLRVDIASFLRWDINSTGPVAHLASSAGRWGDIP